MFFEFSRPQLTNSASALVSLICILQQQELIPDFGERYRQ